MIVLGEDTFANYFFISLFVDGLPTETMFVLGVDTFANYFFYF